MMPVNTAPAKTPRKGFWKDTNRSWNHASCSRNAMELDINSIPVISVVKPRRIVPIPFFFSLLLAIDNKMPMMPISGAKVEGLNT